MARPDSLIREDLEEMAGRRRKGDQDEMVTGPIRMSRPGEEDDLEREPEDTRDMLWQFLRGQNQILDKNFEHQTEAINRCANAVDAIREAQDEQDQRHTAAQLQAAEKMAEAQITAAEKAAEARKFEAKLAAILGALLVLGLLVLAGASVSGKYGNAELSAGHAGQ